MTLINEIIKDYLTSPKTDFAIMICGDWGSGKSHYIHNEFKDIVTSIAVPKRNNNKNDEKDGFL